jgi:surface carbohydrate biosynthesis protein (TIGR04326 family)
MNSEMHTLLDNSLCLRVIVNTLKDYVRIVLAGYRMKNVKQFFLIENTEINLWNVLGFDWKCSIFGKTAISNCLYLNLFEKVFNEIPIQYQGLYLLENQSWERCMIYAWRKNNHGSIIGVANHINDWDLRHFFNVNEYRESEKYKIPIPDKVALNGPFGLNMYVKNLFPKDKIVEVEALRYLHLNSSHRDDNNLSLSENTLLVIPDYDPIIASNQMKLLSRAVRMLTFSINIIVKPHPLSPISEKQFPDLTFKIVSDSLENLTSKYSVAFASNPTTASLDVYLSGKRVIVMLDPNSFNMSPLKGFKDVDFISTEEELSNKISVVNNIIKRPNNNFFYLNPKLSRWSILLQNFN